jgi:WD40 repeat protein
MLAEAPLQVYSSALVFAPEASVVRKTFVGRVGQEVEMLSGRDADWEACRSVLDGHTGGVNAVVFSTGGQLLASASNDKTVRVWETATGICRSVLDSPSCYVGELTFSLDGSALHADGGYIPLPADLNLTSVLHLEVRVSHLLVERQWVLRDTQRFSWLPFEYRGHHTAVCKDMICLGCPSGRVALLKLR